MRELAALGLPTEPGPEVVRDPTSEADLEQLPATAQRYLRFMRVVGRPRDWSFRLGFVGRFRRSRDEGWMKCEAWQYNTRLSLARIFYMQLRFFGFIPVLGRDTYADGLSTTRKTPHALGRAYTPSNQDARGTKPKPTTAPSGLPEEMTHNGGGPDRGARRCSP